MIQVTFFTHGKDGYCGFRFSGHAKYAEAGQDVVCAGVSALVINTVNCIEKLTDDRFTIDSDADTGLIELRLTGSISPDSALLLKALLIGCQGISNDYGTDYVKIHCKEV